MNPHNFVSKQFAETRRENFTEIDLVDRKVIFFCQK